MSQHDERHVMVPPAPEAQFVLIHAQFPLALGKTRFDRPAHSTYAHKRGKWRLERSVAHVELPFRLRGFTADFPPDHHPDLRARQAITRQHGAQHEEIGDQRAFVPL